VKSIEFSPDGKYLVAVGGMQQDELKIWRLPEQNLAAAPSAHSVTINDVAFSSDGRWMATASGDNTVVVWDFVRTEPHRRLKVGSNGGITSVAFSPDGRILAAGGYEGLVKGYEVQTGNLLFVLDGHGDRIRSVVFSPDGKRIVSASVGKRIVIWDVATSQQLMSLSTSDTVNTMAFSPDGRLMVAAQQDGLRVWKGGVSGDAAVSTLEQLRAVFEDSPAAILDSSRRSDMSPVGEEGSLLADAMHRAREQGWKVVAALIPVMEAADPSF
jgi:WD40 repeat protein